MKSAGISALLYGVLILVGGIVGYTTTGSLASAIAGSVFGLGLIASATALLRSKPIGLYLALGLTGVLTIFFSYRFLQTGAWIPGGIMALVSLAALVLLFPALRRRVA
jgi:uncharacterized membrane protein (UPF0136 family)